MWLKKKNKKKEKKKEEEKKKKIKLAVKFKCDNKIDLAVKL